MTFVQSESIQVSVDEWDHFMKVCACCELIRDRSKDPDTRELASKIVPLLSRLMDELAIDFGE